MTSTLESPATRPSIPRLSDLARHVTYPKGIVSTGWPAVRDKCADIGLAFDPWQHGAGRLILAKRADGSYAATVGGTTMSIPRQVGKTFLIGAIVFALCLLFPGLTVIWTAHRLRTADETFKSMMAMSGRPKIAPHMLKPVLGNGEGTIRFRNRSRILFGARERGFGRGFAEVDVLVFDECQILSENAIDDMVPATNQSQHPAGALLLFVGTPPKPTDPGEVFARKRDEALEGGDEDSGYIEFSADPGADPEDLVQIAKANPSFPKRTPIAAIKRMRKNLSRDSFLREAMGIWPESRPGKSSVFGAGKRWEGCVGEPMPWPAPVAVGVAVSHDRSWASIAAAAPIATLDPIDDLDGEASEDAEPQVRVLVGAMDRRPEVDWLSEALGEVLERYPDVVVVLRKGGPAKSLTSDLMDDDIPIEVFSADEYADACELIHDKVRARTLQRMPVGVDEDGEAEVDELDQAVQGAEWQNSGDRRIFGLRKAAAEGVDGSMLEAAALAVAGAERWGDV